MRVSVIGAGYVGLVTGACLAKVGHDVTCVDMVHETVDSVNSGVAPFREPGLNAILSETLNNGRFRATTDLHSAVAGSDVTFVAVGTPTHGGAIDLSSVLNASTKIGQALRDSNDYHVVAVKSTVVPGTTDTAVREALEEASGRNAGDFGLCVNPEFLREGSAVNDFMEPDRIVIGQWDQQSGTTLARTFESFSPAPRLFTTLRDAEFIKYTSNALLATLISFSNEIAALCQAMPGTDVDIVMDGLHLDRRLSPLVGGDRISPGILSYLRAGCGYGGSCLPKDVDAFRGFAREVGVPPHLLNAVAAVNSRCAKQLVDTVESAIGTLDNRTVAVLGLAFKPGTSDIRESPALRVIDELAQRGVTVSGYDPAVALSTARHVVDPQVRLTDTAESALENTDAALICTAWPEFAQLDWDRLISVMRQPIIVDGRNALHGVELPEGMSYFKVGNSHQSIGTK